MISLRDMNFSFLFPFLCIAAYAFHAHVWLISECVSNKITEAFICFLQLNFILLLLTLFFLLTHTAFYTVSFL